MTDPSTIAAIAETLEYFDDEFPVESFPQREDFTLVNNLSDGLTVGQLRALHAMLVQSAAAPQPAVTNADAIGYLDNIATHSYDCKHVGKKSWRHCTCDTAVAFQHINAALRSMHRPGKDGGDNG